MFTFSFHSGKIYFVIEMLLAEMIFLYPVQKRKYFPLRLLLLTAGIVLVAAFFPRMNGVTGIWQAVYQSAIHLILFALTIGGMALCFRMKPIPLVSMCSTGYAVQHLSYKAGTLLAQTSFPALFPAEVLSRSRTCELVMILVCYLVIFFTFGRYSAKYECYKNSDKNLLSLTFIILFVCTVITRFLSSSGSSVSDSIYAITCCLLVLYLQILMHKMEFLFREKQVIQQLRQSEKKQYAISRKTMDMINTKYHDLKHILAVGGVTPEMKSQIEKDVNGYQMFLHTGNEVLDTILAEKLLLCHDQGIRMTFMGNGKDLSFLKTMDLYSLFGNATENAIEAASKLEEEEKKTIGISVEKRGGMCVVSFVNYFKGDLRTEEDDLLTIKEYENGYHGYGMKSMKLIAEKYKGDLSYTAKNELFTLNIYLMEAVQTEG
ncbi:MAG: sensor histidine kinase [Clostridia bacterium]|nr:sensor histidine kinase [Clostridia bacterium]